MSALTQRRRSEELPRGDRVAVDLSAVIVALTGDDPAVLAIREGRGLPEGLPSGPLEPEHRTLEMGLRGWVEEQTRQHLGYVEQLYTFGDRNRAGLDGSGETRALSIGYLALVREARPSGSAEALWRSWYRFFPWEDWRDGRPAALDRIDRQLADWVATGDGPAERRLRDERVHVTFPPQETAWDHERVLERYQLLYEVGLVPEALRDRGIASVRTGDATAGEQMAADHRRILATAIGRLRAKIKYRPVVFELMPPAFTLLQLQRAVEALAGVRLHKPNFRRLVESQGLVEETGEFAAETGGRPARLVRFRRDVLLERPAPGVRIPAPRRLS